MLVQCVLILLVSASQHYCDEGSTEVKPDESVPNEDGVLQANTDAAPTVTHGFENVVLPTGPSRTARRRGRRLRGLYNSDRFRNNAYNPYNPNSPYSFRGRPPQPPYEQGGYYRTGYENPYYDPYKQGYYGYPGYPQPAYYSYPYQPQPPAPQPGQVPVYPPTVPPTEAIPDLYYVRDSPDGYQYQRVSVAPDVAPPRPPPAPQAPQYPYSYQYDPYRRPPPPQPYYQQPQPQYGYPPGQQSSVYQQQMQWAQRYIYPRGRRPRFMRTGRPTLRIPGTEHSWKLTISPESQYGQPTENPQSSVPSEQITEGNVD